MSRRTFAVGRLGPLTERQRDAARFIGGALWLELAGLPSRWVWPEDVREDAALADAVLLFAWLSWRDRCPTWSAAPWPLCCP